MKKYRITTKVNAYNYYTVLAKTEEEARAKYYNGECKFVDQYVSDSNEDLEEIEVDDEKV